MTLNDLLRVFWRRKLLIVIVTLAVVIPSYAATKLVKKQYESTATIALIPKQNDIVFFGLLDTISPYYADAATSHATLSQARQLVGINLCNTSVETFKGTPIMKIHARCSSPRLAQLTAAGVAQALLNRDQNGELQIHSVNLIMADPAALPTAPVFPRTKLTLLVAFLLGLGLGLGAALLRESLTTKVESADDLAAVSGLPVFAEIPAETAILKLHSPEDLATNPRLRVVAEALRDLRTNLLFTDESIRSIVVTGSMWRSFCLSTSREADLPATAATARQPSPSASPPRSRGPAPERCSSTPISAGGAWPSCSSCSARRG